MSSIYYSIFTLLLTANCRIFPVEYSGAGTAILSAEQKIERLQNVESSPPNFVIFFVDDLGYYDVSYNGHPTILTPNIDKLAFGGMRLTQWYTGMPVCSPSRASMLTGRLPVRSGCGGQWNGGIFEVGAYGGLPPTEVTFASVLKQAGYSTKIIGNWHLGVLKEYMPTSHGFDEYFGIPYSVDMGQTPWFMNSTQPPLPLMSNLNIIEQPVNLSNLSIRYIEEAKSFIKTNINNNKPFVLYNAFSHVHTPEFSSPKYCNTSIRGFFGNSISELDNEIGEIFKTIQDLNITNNTLIFFTSDNGPSLQAKLAGGSAGLFRDGKLTTWEGGMRMPAFAYWKGMINSNSISMELTATYDIFTTIINIANATQYLPDDNRTYDGKDMSNILFNLEEGKSKHECIFYYGGTPNDTQTCPYNGTSYGLCAGLWAVRCNQYKAHWVTRQNGTYIEQIPPLIYNVNWDPGEHHPIWPDNKEYNNILNYLTDKKLQHLETIQAGIVNQIDLGTDPVNWLCCDPNSQQKFPNYPNCTCDPQNYHQPICNPICYADDSCETKYPGGLA